MSPSAGLHGQNQNLYCRAGNGVCVCRPVRNAAEVMQIIHRVLKLRARCPTMIHADSSRSHLIVTLTISSKSPNAAALGETYSHIHTHWTAARTPGGQPKFVSVQPAGCTLPKRTCSAPPRSSGGVRAVAAPTPHLMSQVQAPPPRPHPRLVILRVRRPAPGPRRPSSGPNCSWWTWRGVSASVRQRHSVVTLRVGMQKQVHVKVHVFVSGMSGVSGAALWEVSCINRSLSALSDVLGALAEQRPHVPYRNSKLTHLLQDVIGDALSRACTRVHTHFTHLCLHADVMRNDLSTRKGQEVKGL